MPDGEEIIDARDELIATKYQVKPGCLFYQDAALTKPHKTKSNHANKAVKEVIVLARLAPETKNIMEVYDASRFFHVGFVRQTDLTAVTTFNSTFKDRIDDKDAFSVGRLDDDIRQGSVFGNCFLLAGINAIADRVGGQVYLRNMIRQDKNHTSVVRLYHPIRKKFVYYRVNNTYYSEHNTSIISHKNLWIHLIEKAYTFQAMRIDNEYDLEHQFKVGVPAPEAMLNGGSPVSALELLTGEKAVHHRIPVPCSDVLKFADVASYLAHASLVDEIIEAAGTELFLDLLSELRKMKDISIDDLIKVLTFSQDQESNDQAAGDKKEKQEISDEERVKLRAKPLNAAVTAITGRAVETKRHQFYTFAVKLKLFIKTFFDYSEQTDRLKRIITKPELLIFLIRILDKTGFTERYNIPSRHVDEVLKVEAFYRLYNCIQSSTGIYESLINPLQGLADHQLSKDELHHKQVIADEMAMMAEISEMLRNYMNSNECQAHLRRHQDLPCGMGEYSDAAKEMFTYISGYLEDDQALVVASTRGNGEVDVDGLQYEHAYTVIATFEAAHLQTKTPLKFIVLKNPWGHTGVSYEFGHGSTMKAAAKMDIPLGCFAVEWNHFISNFENFTCGRFKIPNALPEHVKQKYDTSFSANMGKSQAMIALSVGSLSGAALIPIGLGLGLIAIPTAPATAIAAGVGMVVGFISYLLGVRQAQKNALGVHVDAKQPELRIDDFVLLEAENVELQDVTEAKAEDQHRLKFNLFNRLSPDAETVRAKAALPQLSRELRDAFQSRYFQDMKKFSNDGGRMIFPVNRIDYQAFRYLITRDLLCAPDLLSAFHLAVEFRVTDEIQNGVGTYAEDIRKMLDAVIQEYYLKCMNETSSEDKVKSGLN